MNLTTEDITYAKAEYPEPALAADTSAALDRIEDRES